MNKNISIVLKILLPFFISTETIAIVGGVSAGKQFPEYVQLWFVDRTNGVAYADCGGVLLTPTKVLTAAHCVSSKKAHELAVYPSLHDFKANIKYDDLINIKEKWDHSEYGKNAAYDMSILELSTRIEGVVTTIYDGNNHENLGLATVVGTGRTHKNVVLSNNSRYLRKADISIASYAECKKEYGNLVNHGLCAGSYVGNIGSCEGDSGSPLFQYIGGKRVIVGSVLGTNHVDCSNQSLTFGFYSNFSNPKVVSFIKEKAKGANFISGNNTLPSVINFLLNN